MEDIVLKHLTAQHTSIPRIVDGNIQVRHEIPGKAGQRVEVYRLPGRPGSSSSLEHAVLFETLIIDADLI